MEANGPNDIPWQIPDFVGGNDKQRKHLNQMVAAINALLAWMGQEKFKTPQTFVVGSPDLVTWNLVQFKDALIVGTVDAPQCDCDCSCTGDGTGGGVISS